jgi:putative ABC transport system ATP-binding protein
MMEPSTTTPLANLQSRSGVGCQGIQKSFGSKKERQQVLFDLHVPSGELTLLVGPSGCGKTTLISILSGILEPDAGELMVLNTRLDALNARAKTAFRKANMGFIFQQFNLIPTLTVSENVQIPQIIKHTAPKICEEKALYWLSKVELDHRANAFPSELSVGQQQRVAIARALASEPKLLVCDEPTASLDAKNGRRVMEMIRELAVQPDRVVIVVTHDNRIYPFADRMIEMEDGRIMSNQRLQAIHSSGDPQ